LTLYNLYSSDIGNTFYFAGGHSQWKRIEPLLPINDKIILRT